MRLTSLTSPKHLQSESHRGRRGLTVSRCRRMVAPVAHLLADKSDDDAHVDGQLGRDLISVMDKDVQHIEQRYNTPHLCEAGLGHASRCLGVVVPTWQARRYVS